MKLLTVSLLIAAMAVSACGKKDKDIVLTRLEKTGDGPDEFSIVPGKPLQEPADYSNLPQPTPGGANLTDQNPLADAAVALGGNPGARQGISPADGALVNHSRRFGVTQGIRETLRREDRETRRRHGKVNILRLGPNNYDSAYKKQWLDSKLESERLRRSGVPTPSGPPIIRGGRRR